MSELTPVRAHPDLVVNLCSEDDDYGWLYRIAENGKPTALRSITSLEIEVMERNRHYPPPAPMPICHP